LEQNRTEASEPVVSEHVWPDGVAEIGPLGDHPEALPGMVDDGDGFAGHRCHGPVFAEEVQGVIGMELALVVEGQVEVQQRHRRDGLVMITFFLAGQLPRRVGSPAGSAANLVFVMPGDLGLEQGVGVFVVGDFFIGQEADEAFLKGIEAAFDFAFGLGVWSDPVGRAQGGKRALELGVRVEPVGGRAVAEEREAVGVEAGGWAVRFEGWAQVGEMIPGGVAPYKGAGDDFAGVIVQGENEHRIGVGGPPGMRGTVVLPEFADGGGLPAAAGFGAAFGGRKSLGKVLADIGGHCGARAMEVQATGQFVSQEREVEGLAVRQEGGQEGVGGSGPVETVSAAGRDHGERVLVREPLMTQFIEPGAADHQPFGSGGSIELAGIEGGKDFLDVKGRDAVGELLLFIGARP